MEKAAPSKGSFWVYNPWLDLLVGCGAWSAPLLLLGYLAGGSSAVVWSITFYGLALFFNYPHYMATIYRAYHTEEDFRKYRIFTVHITALVLVTLLLSHFWRQSLPWIFTLYLCWSPWHYSGQNYGLFMMFARRAGAKPSTNVRQALYSAFLLSYLVLLINFHTGASSDSLFLSLGIPAKVSAAMLIPIGIGFAGFSLYALSQLAKETGWKPLLPSLTLFSTQFLWFLLPTVLSLVKGLQVPQSRYSTGVMAVMHSAQYLWITSFYARREATTENTNRWRPFAYFGVLIAGGIALFIPGPWLASRIFHFDFGASFLIFTALVNIHHFILDGAIWKLRDGRIASLLLNSQERVARSSAEAGNRAVAGLRWLVGGSKRAHAFRMALALALLAWAGLDQMRYYLRVHAENLSDLQLAASLNAFDSGLQTRIGRKQIESGQTDAAVAAWKNALKLNPADAVSRDSLLQYFTSRKRFAEAYALTEGSLRYSPEDANLLVNNGILAKQSGHAAEAVQSWSSAIALDPSQLSARLYLAGELQQQGKCDQAVPQYLSFLGAINRLDPAKRPSLATVVPVVMELASCQQQEHKPADAEKSYELVRNLSVQVGDKSMESLASIYQAQLEANDRHTNQALALYQQALQADKAVANPHSEAQDWYTYAIFLRDAGFPTRLSYACLMKSERLMKSLKEAPELKLVADARAGMAKDAKSVNAKNLQTVLDEALALKGK